MNQPTLTIGIATYNDFEGLWPTIQSIRLHNAQLMGQTQFVVVNNHPEDRATAAAIRGLLGVPTSPEHDYTLGVDGQLPDCFGTTYVELPGNKGTSPSRDRIFRHAKGKYTAVLDCHLEFWPGSFDALLKHYASDPESRDIITGPLLLDSLRQLQTHFRDAWDDGMWGRWSAAWQCQCGPDGSRFDLAEVTSESGTKYAMPRELKIGNIAISACAACGKPIPDFTWEGHELKYLQRGFSQLAYNDGPAFEIPGQGLGFFSCRTEIWPGFNPHAMGFGGEEMYIHEKFRQRGGRALCVPGVKWVHRFYRTGGAKYPNTDFWKARNYVLEFQELGLSLEPVKRHFVDTPVRRFLEQTPPVTRSFISEVAWQALMEDAIGTTEDPTDRLTTLEAAAQMLPDLTTIDAVFDVLTNTERDLNRHMPALRALTNLAGGVAVELTARQESTVALLAGTPQQVISFTTELSQHCWKAAALVRETTRFTPRNYQMGLIFNDLPANDLLFVDTLHRYAQLHLELTTYAPKCRRFIVIHDTDIHGERGEDGGLGLRLAIAEFCDAHQQWAVIDHTKEQYGLTVLSCVIEDRPEQPVEGFNIPRGPGTELKKILTNLGINPGPSCACNGRAAQMDAWGPDVCEEPERFETIVGWLREGTWNGLDLAGAAARSFFTGIAWEINPLHPFESLVTLCIKRARETAAKRAAV